ncbi:hypothetical protein, variant 1 [Verruconis gallopava]|uniref:Efficient mitochondria targeting-associated protein 19 n=1 Tax=Verruconis gallopava TaxID=253628 RepID=A0A0D1YZA7_9PEZI|nr:hypothetical protein, variant 1 [Verruconis gallopava]KIW06002.1 hypothetical protein, variant 1 [Verruconis gallopava]
MATSILGRKMDFIYLIFFAIHIPVVILVDSYILWPPARIPAFMTNLRQFYIATYKDIFFINPPAWFHLYVRMEAVYHLPISAWAVYGLLTDAPLVPLHLLIYAVQTGVTTATCIAEALSWQGLSGSEKNALMGLYLPYLAVSIFMGIDMFMRLSSIIHASMRDREAKKLN